MPIRKTATCHSCGQKVAYTVCGESQTLPEDTRCKVLDGWFTVSQWHGIRSIETYDFCSLTCLQKWVGTQVPQVPKTFLEAFQEE